MHVSNYGGLEPFITADGSTIREWAGPSTSPAVNQSLAEATIAVGGATAKHYHPQAEEFYLLTGGTGRMRLVACRSAP